MAGTKAGGIAAAETNKKLHGPDFYKRIGRMGGGRPKTRPAGFAADRERAREAGRRGGTVSRRGKSKPKPCAFCLEPLTLQTLGKYHQTCADMVIEERATIKAIELAEAGSNKLQ